MKVDSGMITLQNNDDTRPRRNIVKIKVKKPWEVPTGHRQDRNDTSMDNRPKRQRTRKDIELRWREEYE